VAIRHASTLTAAVALAETVDAFSPIHCAIKWPNDILIKDRKLAGILIEASCSGAGLDYVVLGIGVNLNFAPEAMPAAISGRATSLLAVREQEVNREEFLRRLIQDLDRCYGILQDQGFGALAPRWETRFLSKGKKVQVELGDCVLHGTPVGIDSDGALILRTEDDNLQRIIAGDVIPALE
jgi:BirA family transcriptional regulator, biotin operon repressor / biotin---[acetyl-CoA-carboxylase] ligase